MYNPHWRLIQRNVGILAVVYCHYDDDRQTGPPSFCRTWIREKGIFAQRHLANRSLGDVRPCVPCQSLARDDFYSEGSEGGREGGREGEGQNTEVKSVSNLARRHRSSVARSLRSLLVSLEGLVTGLVIIYLCTAPTCPA